MGSAASVAAMAAALAFVAFPGRGLAGTVLATFEATGTVGCSYVAVEDLPSRRYSFALDLSRQGERRNPDGSTYTMQDGPGLEMFFAQLVEGNYVESSTTDAQPDYRFGMWFNHSSQNAWCSGASYGAFNYQTIATLGSGRQDDQVSIIGMWATAVPFEGAQSFLTPGAVWMISDNGRTSPTSMRAGLFFGQLVSITAVTSTVPEPATASLLALGFLAAVLSGRSRVRSAS